MADTPKVYVICENNCKYESLTKEQILTAITEAIATGNIGNCDTGFITTIKTINGNGLKFFVGSQAEYNELSDADKQGLFAIITDDATKDGIYTLLNGIINGDTEVGFAKKAEIAYRDRNGKDIVTDKLLKVIDFPMQDQEGYLIFDAGTLLTLEVYINQDGAKSLTMFETITGLVINGGTPQVLYLAEQNSGNDYVNVGGQWKVCGKCGAHTTTVNNITTTKEYYLVQKI